jgi:hypothetical protein
MFVREAQAETSTIGQIHLAYKYSSELAAIKISSQRVTQCFFAESMTTCGMVAVVTPKLAVIRKIRQLWLAA